MNMDWIRSLIRLVEESEIDSLEVERLTTKIRIRKSPGGAPAVSVAPPQVVPSAPAPVATASAKPSAEITEPVVDDSLVEVVSPMVGTFYAAPAPEEPPFVTVGDRVEAGQTLCILEAMKLMNELESDVAGVVREILAENADPVEYGQALFRIEPS